MYCLELLQHFTTGFQNIEAPCHSKELPFYLFEVLCNFVVFLPVSNSVL